MEFKQRKDNGEELDEEKKYFDLKKLYELKYLFNIYTYIGLATFIISFLVYLYFSANQGIQLINISIPSNNITINYQIPSSSLDIFKVVVGSSLTAIVPLALYGAKLEKDKAGVIKAVEGIIAKNSTNAILNLVSLEQEVESINLSNNYKEFKLLLPDLLPFSEIVFKNIDYFLDNSNFIAIASKVEYLIK